MPSASLNAGLTDARPSPTYAPQTARGRATRQKLLDAAVAEFGDKGFHAASVSAITSRALIGQGTFYIYFASKDQCFHYVVEHTSRAMRRVLLRGLSQLDLASALSQSISRFLRFAEEQPEALRTLNEARLVHPDGWNDHVGRLIASFTDLLERHAQTLDKDADRTLHAHFLVGALQHLATLPRDALPDTEVTAAALTRSVLCGVGGHRNLNGTDRADC